MSLFPSTLSDIKKKHQILLVSKKKKIKKKSNEKSIMCVNLQNTINVTETCMLVYKFLMKGNLMNKQMQVYVTIMDFCKHF